MSDLCSIAGNSQQPCCLPEHQVMLPTICFNDVTPTPEPHEPPMGFDGGSLRMSWDDEIVETVVAVNPSDPRPRKYILADSDVTKGPVAVVRILTERDNGLAGFTRYIVPKDKGGRVRIWLQQLVKNSSDDEPKYEDPTDEPQIVVKGDPFLLEVDRQLRGSFPTQKPSRVFGYDHPGFARHFRIAKWAIVDAAGSVIKENNTGDEFTDEGADAYKIYVSFHD